MIAGVDVSSTRFSPVLHAGVVVWDRVTKSVVDSAAIALPETFPYIPGLLSFREAPGVERAFARLRVRPELVIVDGNGLAHPRRFGIACHLGVAWDLPTIGCAKSRLLGEHDEPGRRRGCYRSLRDHRELIGRVVRTRDGVRPVYLSVGHKITLDDATRWLLATCKGYRLPEPIRLAHALVNDARRAHVTS